MAFVRPAKQPGSLGDLPANAAGPRARLLERVADRGGVGPRRTRPGARRASFRVATLARARASTEFYEFPHSVGDDAGRIDWKVYARSDRLYLRASPPRPARPSASRSIARPPCCSGAGSERKGQAEQTGGRGAMATAFGLITPLGRPRRRDRLRSAATRPASRSPRRASARWPNSGTHDRSAQILKPGPHAGVRLNADGLRDTLRSVAQLSSIRLGASAARRWSSCSPTPSASRARCLRRARGGPVIGHKRHAARGRADPHPHPEEADGPPIGTQRLRGLGLRHRHEPMGTRTPRPRKPTERECARDTLRHGVLAMGGRPSSIARAMTRPGARSLESG